MKIDVQKTMLLFASGIATVGLLCSCMELSMRPQNWKSLDIYGKVIDQYGKPVPSAKVRGAVGLNINMVESGGKFIYTQTDPQGCFHFLHIHGAGIGIWPQKEGYYYNLKIPWQRPADYVPRPNNPLIFTMWKIRGAQPLVQSEMSAPLATDGHAEHFDISSGRAVPDGDFQISFTRSPRELNSGLAQKFDWHFEIEILNGGIVQEDTVYPFLAPESGYQPAFQVTIISNQPSWQNQYNQNFYIKSSSGKFGVMNVNIYSATQEPQFHAHFVINPSGARELEPASFP